VIDTVRLFINIRPDPPRTLVRRQDIPTPCPCDHDSTFRAQATGQPLRPVSRTMTRYRTGLQPATVSTHTTTINTDKIRVIRPSLLL